MNLPSLSKARLHIDTNYYLLLISLVITGSGSALELTDYPEQHKPELSECQKREFPRLNSIEKSLKLWNKRNRNRRDRKNVQCCFFFSAGCLFKWILGCNRSLWAMLADSDEKKVSCPWFVSVLSPRSIIQFFFLFTVMGTWRGQTYHYQCKKSEVNNEKTGSFLLPSCPSSSCCCVDLSQRWVVKLRGVLWHPSGAACPDRQPPVTCVNLQ